MITVGEIAEQLNALAASLAPSLLPNGHMAGKKWMASGIADTGKSASLYVHLTGPRQGHWADMGGAARGEEHGDMLDLLRLTRCGGDARRAISEAKQLLGIADAWQKPTTISGAQRQAAAARANELRMRAAERERQAAFEVERKSKRAMALFLSGVPIKGTPAERYLHGRGLSSNPIGLDVEMEWPGSLRFHDEVWHGQEKLKIPALLAAIYTAEGRQIGVQRIYLARDKYRQWRKLMTADPKRVTGSMWGGFVPINKGSSGKSMAQMPADEPVYVTEGIEDAIAVRMLKPNFRIIAAVSLPNIGAIVLPEAAKKLVIVADRDESEVAQDALERAIACQQSRGLKVGIVMPPEGVKDMNDWLNAWRNRKDKGDGTG